MSTNQVQRVVIFGREGLAREQLVNALSDIGVVPVWVGKPIQSSPDKLSELNPSQIIISLEPLIESELLPYSDFLNQTEISVMYDDAESTRHLSGWDLNRWARHMASKLLNQGYMPSANTNEIDLVHEDQKIVNEEIYLDKFILDNAPVSAQLADTSSNELKVSGLVEVEMKSIDWQSTEDYDVLDINPEELGAALDKLNKNLSDASSETEIQEMNFDKLIPLTDTEILDFERQTVSKQMPNENEFSFDLEDSVDVEINSFDIFKSDEIIDDEPSVYMDEAALRLAESNLEAQLGNSGASSAFLNSKLELQDSETESFDVVASSETKVKPREFDLSKYSLEGDGIDGSSTDAEEKTASNAVNLNAQNPTSDRSLFLVISGVGGPGVVRSIVSNVKNNFSGIVVLSQEIEATQLPKFLVQLQKVVSIPVVIPIAEEYLKSGNIYLLPDKFTIQLTTLGYQCISYGNLADFIAKANQDVEIVVLSGAEPSLAQSLIQVSSVMTNIYVQSPVECFDATLPQLLVNMGVPVIEQEILDKWFN